MSHLHHAHSYILEPGYCPVRLGMTTGRLQSGVNTLQGFKEDKRNKVTPGKAPMWQCGFSSSHFQGVEEKKHNYHYFNFTYGIFATLIRYFKETQNEFAFLFFPSPL